MKQINIFDEIDYINEDGSINRCEMCGCSMEKQADVCSKECAEDWVEMYLP